MYTGPMSTSSDWQQILDSLEDEFQAQQSFTLSPSGDGYWCEEHGARCFRSCPDRRWGRYGAAGILFVHPESQRFFLAQRSPAVHLGGTWSVPGGALDFGESAEDGARREVFEELGMGLGGRVVAEYVDAVGSEWAYTTVVVEVDSMDVPTRFDWETSGCGWFTIQEMSTMTLHPAFRKSFWSVVRAWVGA